MNLTKQEDTRKGLITLISLSIVLFVIYVFVFRVAITRGDYGYHNGLAHLLSMGENYSEVDHQYPILLAGYHYSVAFLSMLSNLPVSITSVILLSSAYVAVFYIVYYTFRKNYSFNVSILYSLCICFACSIYNPFTQQFYLTQPNGLIFHNPTFAFMKPFALLHFLTIIHYYNGSLKRIKLICTLSGILLAMLTIIKPSYTLGILATLAVLFIYVFIKNKKVKILDYALLVLPAVIILALQYLSTYQNPDNAAIIFSPFTVALHYNNSSIYMVMLSVLFTTLYPLISLIVFINNKIRLSFALIISYINFFLQAIFAYFFAESGYRTLHGNTMWGYALAVFLVFLTTGLEMKKLDNKSRKWLSVVLFIHLIMGALYILRFVFTVYDM